MLKQQHNGLVQGHPAACVRVKQTLAERAQQLWLAQNVAETSVSRLHRSVAAGLTALGETRVVNSHRDQR